MTIKELAHSIVDSFNENQLKGFVDLFIKSEPAVEDRSIETIMRSLAMDYIHNYSSARYREGINDQIMGYLELGRSYNMAHLCAYRRALIETETKFYGIMKLKALSRMGGLRTRFSKPIRIRTYTTVHIAV